MQKSFFKNLYQTISCFVSIMVLVFALLLGFIESLKYENNFGWILLPISLALIALFFTVGFYWIFQKVNISEKGIKVVFINKVIKECSWGEIEAVEAAQIMKNPALRVKLSDGSEIHLDKRASIIKAIERYRNR